MGNYNPKLLPGQMFRLFVLELAVERVARRQVVEREFVWLVVEAFGREAQRESVGSTDLRTQDHVFRTVSQGVDNLGGDPSPTVSLGVSSPDLRYFYSLFPKCQGSQPRSLRGTVFRQGHPIGVFNGTLSANRSIHIQIQTSIDCIQNC